jgi:hypothetical protein
MSMPIGEKSALNSMKKTMIKTKIILTVGIILTMTGCSNTDDLSQDVQTLDGPYWQNLMYTKSDDWDSWQKSTLVIEHASAPDVLVLDTATGPYEAGDILLIFTFFPENIVGAGELSLMVSSDDGETWSDRQKLDLIGAGDHIPVDPSINQLESGEIVLTYQDLTESVPSSKEHTFYIALSTDVETFTYEKKIFTSENFAINPDIVRLNDTWFMYSGTDSGDRQIHVTTGDENFIFSSEVTTGIAGMPGAIIDENEIVLFGCGLQGGISVSRSRDGLTFQETVSTNVGGCAPAPFLLSAGGVGVIHTYSEK